MIHFFATSIESVSHNELKKPKKVQMKNDIESNRIPTMNAIVYLKC